MEGWRWRESTVERSAGADARAGPCLSAAGRRTRPTSPDERGLAAPGSMGRLAGQLAPIGAVADPRPSRGYHADHVGGPVPGPGVGPDVQRLRRAGGGCRPVHTWPDAERPHAASAGDRHGRPTGSVPGRPHDGLRPGRSRDGRDPEHAALWDDDRAPAHTLGGCAPAARLDRAGAGDLARRRQARADPPVPARIRASVGRIRSSGGPASGRLGRRDEFELAGGRADAGSDARQATSGSWPRTSRRSASRRLRRLQPACCPAATPTGCAGAPIASCSCLRRRFARRFGRRGCGREPCS